MLLAGLDGLEGLGEALRRMLGLEVQQGVPESHWPALAALPGAARVRVAALAAAVAGAGQP